MADIKYEGSSVNSAVNQLTTVSGRFQPVANDVRTKTGVMIGCKGFNYIGSGASSDIYSGVITSCEQKVAGLVGDIRRKQSTILTYSQNQSDIDDFVDSLSTQEYYALKDSGALKGFDKKISGWAKAGFIADNIFSTACTFALGFVEGVGDFVESVGDGVIMLAGSAVSGVADLVGADDFANEVSEWTRATVAYDVTGNAFDSLYANTEFGQYLQNNSTVFDQARGLGNGIGYSAGVIAANALFPGVGMVGFAAAAGFGNAGERAYADGAELGEGLVYSAASAGWEAVQWTVGMKIGGLSIPGASKFASAALRVGLDGVDSGLEGFVQPALTMIYKDYPGETLAEQYGAAFNDNGGWDTVWTQFAVGSTMSGISEASNVFKNRRGRNKTSVDGEVKETGLVDPNNKLDVSNDPDVKAADARAEAAGIEAKEARAEADRVNADPNASSEAKLEAENLAKSAEARAKAAGMEAKDVRNQATERAVEANKNNSTTPGDNTNKTGDSSTTQKPADPVESDPNVRAAEARAEAAGMEAKDARTEANSMRDADNQAQTRATDAETRAAEAEKVAADAEQRAQAAEDNSRSTLEEAENKYDKWSADDDSPEVDSATKDNSYKEASDALDKIDGADADAAKARAEADKARADAEAARAEADKARAEADETSRVRKEAEANATSAEARAKAAKMEVDDARVEAQSKVQPEADIDAEATKRTWREKAGDAWDATKRVAGDAVDRVKHADYRHMPSSVIADEATDTIVEGQDHGIDTGYQTPVDDTQTPSVDLTSPTGDDIQFREEGGPQIPGTPEVPGSPTTPVDPTVPTVPTQPIDPTDPTVPTVPTDPTNPTDPTDPTNPVNPGDPSNPDNPYNPGNGGHSGSGFGGDDEFNGAAFSLDDEFGDDFDSIADILARGSGNIPSSNSPIRAGGNGVSAFIPISAGLSAAAAVGLGTKAFLDKKNKEDEEDEDDDNLDSYLFEDESEESFEQSFEEDDDYSFIPEELLLDD